MGVILFAANLIYVITNITADEKMVAVGVGAPFVENEEGWAIVGQDVAGI